MPFHLEHQPSVRMLKDIFAPDGGAEREHNASEHTLGFGSLHYGLVANLRPRRALVVGSRFGFVPAIVGLAQLANGYGEVDFVDANYDDAIEGRAVAFGGVGHWTDAAKEVFAKMGLQDVVHVHVMRTEHFFPGCGASYDYIYLDGDHSYEGCSYDFAQACRVAAPGATILLHDVLVEDAGFGVGRLFAELDPARYDKMLVARWPGLGLVQPRAEGAA